ncbi:hypothetical protein [Microtetraspora sp. NBRC 13810]|uniref:hypothetical protein n=1 Tax=Microtetraspora sp. NBRC 13810 TaxID=3030990 RepID=UPI0025521014|nr:hypothetical protein [Microtetraspora sp. NBRC 13810]
MSALSVRARLIAAAGVCVLLAGGAGFFLLREGDPLRPAVFGAERTSALYSPIDSRTRDPEPLTVQELFASAELGTGSAGLVRQATETLTDCAEAVWGDGVIEAVRGCSQALRARYESADGKVAAQFLIFNLPDGAAADRLLTALASGGFVRPAPDLPGGFDPARSRAQGRALGHYVTVAWVGPVGGRGRTDLTAQQLALDTLTRPLQQRVIDAT